MTDSKNNSTEPKSGENQAQQEVIEAKEKPKSDTGAKPEKANADAPAAKTEANEKKSTDKSKAAAKEPSQLGKEKAQPVSKKPAGAKRPFPLTAAVALALGLAVAGASYLNFSRWQLADLQAQSMSTEIDKLQSSFNSQLGEIQQQVSGMQRQDLDLNLTSEKLRSDLSLQTDSLKQLGQQVKALAADKGKDPMLWRLAEVEFLLSVANHQLVLERDLDTALIALQDADRRLEAIGDPALIPVRKLIASETTKLNSVDVPDVTGMALRLSSLVDNIEKLPLVNRERVKTDLAVDDSMVDNVSELMAKIMKDLKGVVSIRRSDQPIEPLLPPDEQHYLSQNLALKLEEARIALLHRDTATFRQNLTDTREWVQRYFDQNSAAVTTVFATMDDLQGVELKPELPDISGSLRELRRWLSLQQQQRTSAAGSYSG